MREDLDCRWVFIEDCGQTASMDKISDVIYACEAQFGKLRKVQVNSMFIYLEVKEAPKMVEDDNNKSVETLSDQSTTYVI